jgi:hypothetical protein
MFLVGVMALNADSRPFDSSGLTVLLAADA